MAHNGPARQSLGQQEDSLQQHQLIVEGSLLQLQGTVQGSVGRFCSLDYNVQRTKLVRVHSVHPLGIFQSRKTWIITL
jgi:hypothetical protein